MILRVGGTQGGTPNFLPFSSIWGYLSGRYGSTMAYINLLGNIILLVPVGLMIPLVSKRVKWAYAILIAGLVGLSIESTQLIFHVGIFDIDDVILNAAGVVIGFLFSHPVRRLFLFSLKPKYLISAALVSVLMIVLVIFYLQRSGLWPIRLV